MFCSNCVLSRLRALRSYFSTHDLRIPFTYRFSYRRARLRVPLLACHSLPGRLRSIIRLIHAPAYPLCRVGMATIPGLDLPGLRLMARRCCIQLHPASGLYHIRMGLVTYIRAQIAPSLLIRSCIPYGLLIVDQPPHSAIK